MSEIPCPNCDSHSILLETHVERVVREVERLGPVVGSFAVMNWWAGETRPWSRALVVSDETANVDSWLVEILTRESFLLCDNCGERWKPDGMDRFRVVDRSGKVIRSHPMTEPLDDL